MHRSPKLRALLGDSADATCLVAQIRSTADEALMLRRRSAGMPSVGNPLGCRKIAGAEGQYRLRAAFLPPGDVAGPAILVEVENGIPLLPTISDLSERGLTTREAQVAVLLAGGASNVESGSVSASASIPRASTPSTSSRSSACIRGRRFCWPSRASEHPAIATV